MLNSTGRRSMRQGYCYAHCKELMGTINWSFELQKAAERLEPVGLRNRWQRLHVFPFWCSGFPAEITRLLCTDSQNLPWSFWVGWVQHSKRYLVQTNGQMPSRQAEDLASSASYISNPIPSITQRHWKFHPQSETARNSPVSFQVMFIFHASRGKPNKPFFQGVSTVCIFDSEALAGERQ